MAVAIPWIATAFSAFGSAKQGEDSQEAAEYNSQVYRIEGATASRQGFEAESQQRRQGAQVIGKEVAAAGAAGGGYGGSVGRSIAQSATDAEHDALAIRYKAALQRWSYNTQGSNIEEEGRTAARAGSLRAGASLLQGYSRNYTSGDNLG